MNWAPCLAASWARCSCFWIIDSLSPVQLACRSAPRTVRGIRHLARSEEAERVHRAGAAERGRARPGGPKGRRGAIALRPPQGPPCARPTVTPVVHLHARRGSPHTGTMPDAPKPAPRPGRPLVVANPMASGLADADRRRRMVASIVSAVERRTGRTTVVADSTAEDTRAALEQARDAELVVVAGGDGTIRDAAEHLIGSGVPMAIVPAGTANVFGAALGVPRGIKGAIDLIATGRPTSVDVGRATWGAMTDRVPGEPTGSRAFVVACGLGFDARVMAGATPALKRQLGFGAYVVSAARQAARLRPVDFRIEADGVLHEIRGL